MQITIDTKKDSPEEIKKAIQLLSVLVQGRVKNSNIFEDDTPPPTPDPTRGNAFANIFGDTPPPIPPARALCPQTLIASLVVQSHIRKEN